MMYFKRIKIISLIFTIVIAIPLSFIKLKYGLGFLLGGLVSILGFILLIKTGTKAETSTLKKSLKRSRLLRMLIYGLSLIISLIFPEVLNIYSLFLGLFVVKLAIVVNQYFKKGLDNNEYFDV